MITFKELRIGIGAERACTLCGTSNGSPAGPAPYSDIETRINADHFASVMMRGFEPFSHPHLVEIISKLMRAGTRQIGIRTNGAALGNPRDAQGCIETGVRVFEIPILAGTVDKSDRMSAISGLHDRAIQGIKQINASAADLKLSTFVCAVIPLCSHNANQLIGATQEALRAGAQAIRIECSDARYLDRDALTMSHTLATRASVAFFGDGCEKFINGAQLYEVTA